MKNKRFNTRLARLLALSLGVPLAASVAPRLAHAQTLTWDANGATAGQTDGAGAWLGTNQWYNGTTNQTWVSGSNAVFGNGGAGGAVTLASPTTANSITFNSFTGTYTLGTTGQALTINAGITMNSGAGAATFVSPLVIAANQSWTNNSASTLTLSGANTTTSGAVLSLAGAGTFGIGSSGVLTSGVVTSGPLGTGTVNLGSGVQIANTSATVNKVIYNALNLNGSITLATTNNTANAAGSFYIDGGINVAAGGETITLVNPNSNGQFSLNIGGGVGSTNSQITGGTLDFENGNAGATPNIVIRNGSGVTNDFAVISTNLIIGNGITFLTGVASSTSASTSLTVNTGGVLNTSSGGGTAVSLTVGSLSGGGTIINGVTATGIPTFTVDGGNGTGTTTFSGVIQNGPTAAINFAKTGSTTQVLSGANTYTGTTTVNGGVLQVTSANGLGFGGMQILSAGVSGTAVTPSGSSTTPTLDLKGSITANEPITLNGTTTGGSSASLINSSVGTTAVVGNGVAGVQFTARPSNLSLSDLGTSFTFSGGGGSGAAASLTSLGLTTSTVTVASGGTGYVTGNTITVTGGGSTSGAVYNVTASAGVITGLTLASATSTGGGFTSLSGLTFTGAKGTQTTFAGTGASFNTMDGTLTAFGISTSAAGTGYTSTPTVTGAGLTMTAVTSSLALTGTQNQIGGNGNLRVCF